ncbi:MAG: BON domain-containing protein [Taibaiella sp.]|jgi:osmotically-inducible protein OsmY
MKLMKSDFQIQNDVQEEILWEPLLVGSVINATVKDGVVTLNGLVDTYAKKLAAENAAKRVAGVKAVAVDIHVWFWSDHQKSDTEIAEAILNVLKWNTAVQEENIKIKVEDGYVTLDGEVEWEYQRAAAKAAIENLDGIKSVVSLITLKPRTKGSDIEKKIFASFYRHAALDAKQINVIVTGTKAVLTGSVRSFAESDDAEKVAWSAPGITSVDNKLEVEEFQFEFDD